MIVVAATATPPTPGEARADTPGETATEFASLLGALGAFPVPATLTARATMHAGAGEGEAEGDLPPDAVPSGGEPPTGAPFAGFAPFTASGMERGMAGPETGTAPPVHGANASPPTKNAAMGNPVVSVTDHATALPSDAADGSAVPGAAASPHTVRTAATSDDAAGLVTFPEAAGELPLAGGRAHDTPPVPAPLHDAAAAASAYGSPDITRPSPAGERETPAPRAFGLQASLGSPAWREELGAHLVILARDGEQIARISLSPPELGDIDLRIALDSDTKQVTLQFAAAQPAAREALENALPRLRELMAEGGFTLAEAGVAPEGFDSRDSPPPDAGDGRDRHVAGRPGPGYGNGVPVHRVLRGAGLLDVFA